MLMGPCGGVRADGGCEVVPGPCAFGVPAAWADPVPAVPLREVPLILTDFSSEPYSPRVHAAVAGILAPVSDAVLAGEHQDRPDFPPSLLAPILQQAGAKPWITLSCRDRNRVVLEQELHGLRQLGVDAVLCVTGDARAHDIRPDATQVFDLDGPRLAALAAATGLSAAVPETPGAPPQDLRAYRLRGSFVSLLLWEGHSLTYVADQAGHSVATLAKHYAGVLDEREEQAHVPAADANRAARTS